MPTPRALLAFSVVALAVATSSASSLDHRIPSTGPESTTGIDLTAIDRSMSPTEDFFQFANGAWIKTAEIPADRAAVGTFDDLQTRNLTVLREVAEGVANDAHLSPRSARGKVGLFYRVAMDEARAERLGVAPLQPELDRIARVHDTASLWAEIAHLHRIGVGVAFRAGAGQDEKDASRVIMNVRQGGLGIPTRETYLNDDARSKRVRARYLATVTKALVLTGSSETDATASANAILALETQLARASLTPVQLRDTEANYHITDLAGLRDLAPTAEWSTYFDGLGVRNLGAINVGQPGYLKELNRALRDTPLTTWRDYFRYHLTATASPYLSRAFADNQFAFTGSLRGLTEQQPRWRRALGATEGALGEAIGQLWVERKFSPAAKSRALAMVQTMRGVLRDRIKDLEWMSPETKTRAIAKLDAFQVKIGYPDKWRDYGRLTVRDDSYVQNVFRASEFSTARSLAKLGRPVVRNEWGMTPPTVNAYYSPSLNEIVFPAGILQSPFFDPDAPDAANYGAIGAVIGHEMTHGFDDSGRKFDPKGNLKDWWTAEDATRFKQRSDALVRQYNGYTVVEDVHINGQLTLGENIADLGGLKVAYLAFKRATEGHPQPTVGGFTPDQQFFIAFAQVWRRKSTAAAERLQALTDPHSASRYRVLGTLANTPEFWESFGARTPGEPIRIW